MKTFFDSNSFSGLATILTGLVAYIIFRLQKREERLKAARIILMEIEDCESLFNTIKQNGILNLSEIRQLPISDSWNKYKYIFAKKLKNSDLKLIDNFYNTCFLINKELNEAYSLPDFWREKGRIVAEKHASFSESSKDKKEYEEMKEKIKLFEEDSYWWQPFEPSKKIIERIKSIQYITTTPTGDRLKEIAKIIL